jgi:hypothetical protein
MFRFTTYYMYSIIKNYRGKERCNHLFNKEFLRAEGEMWDWDDPLPNILKSFSDITDQTKRFLGRLSKGHELRITNRIKGAS